MLPGRRINKLIGGWLARALETHGRGIEIYAFIFMSNHFHILLKDSHGMLPSFMWFFKTNLAKALNKEMGRNGGTIFNGRYKASLVDGNEAFENRLAYTLGNAVKAGIVDRASRWNGLSSFDASVNSGQLFFDQFDAEAFVKAKRKNKRIKKNLRKRLNPADFVRPFEIPIAAPPMLSDKPDYVRRSFVSQLVKSFEHEWSHKRPTENSSANCCSSKYKSSHSFTDRPSDPSFAPDVPFFCFDIVRKKELLAERDLFNADYRKIFRSFRKSATRKTKLQFRWPEWGCPPGCLRPVGYVVSA